MTLLNCLSCLFNIPATVCLDFIVGACPILHAPLATVFLSSFKRLAIVKSSIPLESLCFPSNTPSSCLVLLPLTKSEVSLMSSRRWPVACLSVSFEEVLMFICESAATFRCKDCDDEYLWIVAGLVKALRVS